MAQKKNPDLTHGTKVTLLLAKLLFPAGKKYSLTQLKNVLDCSKQSVLRIIDNITLAQAHGSGILIREEIGEDKKKYFWIDLPHTPAPRRSRPDSNSLGFLTLCDLSEPVERENEKFVRLNISALEYNLLETCSNLIKSLTGERLFEETTRLLEDNKVLLADKKTLLSRLFAEKPSGLEGE